VIRQARLALPFLEFPSSPARPAYAAHGR
jgi:hypothetical protein